MILLGLALFVIAGNHAFEVWQSHGTDRVRLGVRVIMAPFFGVPVLAIGSLLLRLRRTGGSGHEGWGKWLPLGRMRGMIALPAMLTTRRDLRHRLVLRIAERH